MALVTALFEVAGFRAANKSRVLLVLKVLASAVVITLLLSACPALHPLT